MCITEYNEAETMEMFKEEGRKEGRKEGQKDLLQQIVESGLLTQEQVSIFQVK